MITKWHQHCRLKYTITNLCTSVSQSKFFSIRVTLRPVIFDSHDTVPGNTKWHMNNLWDISLRPVAWMTRNNLVSCQSTLRMCYLCPCVPNFTLVLVPGILELQAKGTEWSKTDIEHHKVKHVLICIINVPDPKFKSVSLYPQLFLIYKTSNGPHISTIASYNKNGLSYNRKPNRLERLVFWKFRSHRLTVLMIVEILKFKFTKFYPIPEDNAIMKVLRQYIKNLEKKLGAIWRMRSVSYRLPCWRKQNIFVSKGKCSF